MEMLGIVLLLIVVFWFVGFFKSTKRIANIANRGATSLELGQLQTLQQKWSKEEVTKAKAFASEFDAI